MSQLVSNTEDPDFGLWTPGSEAWSGSPPKLYHLVLEPWPTPKKISSKSIHKFASNPTDRQTNRQTDRQTDKQTNRPHQPSFICFLHHYNPQHHSCSIGVPDSLLHNLSPSPLWCTSWVWHPPFHTPYISSPNHCLLFAKHAHTKAICFAIVTKMNGTSL